MKRYKVYESRKEYFNNNWKYLRANWSDFDYSILEKIMYLSRSGRGDNDSYNDCIMMLDTETSKKRDDVYNAKGEYQPLDNHIVIWTLSIRAFGMNIVTLYGRKPSECISCITKVHDVMRGDKSIIYIHNMAYDWTFLRRFMMQCWGTPDHQLNTKPHYPIYIEFANGLIFKDSLILAQRSLEKWAKDLNVEHQKALGQWDYDKLRNQDSYISEDELTYAEFDTLVGVECIQAQMDILNKHIYSIPYTATGIVREDVRTLGKKNRARDWFKKQALSYDQYLKMTCVYHGGYTHGNRHLINQKLGSKEDLVRCYDFASSYPFCLLAKKFPGEKFTPSDIPLYIDDIISDHENTAYYFEFIALDVKLKNDHIAMPALQFSKMIKCVNAVLDNGRVLSAAYIDIWLTEQDLLVISEQYEFSKHVCCNVEFSHKKYLPRWLTDYIFDLFRQKTMLKGEDSVAYAISKSKVNSVYGMHVQRSIRDEISENYVTGEYIKNEIDPEFEYQKYLLNHNSILPYQIGVWVTAYAFYDLFQLGKCCDTWIYSDTDSCYALGWDIDKIMQYNEHCKNELMANGYGPIVRNNREYWLGIAENDGDNDAYYEFKVMGAKRYCGRNVADNELHITVAGVPKKGAKCLNDDISNFKKGFIFDGETTGKLTHTYIYRDDIYIDDNGNETADSVDLSKCDYLLDSVELQSWDSLTSDEIEMVIPMPDVFNEGR